MKYYFFILCIITSFKLFAQETAPLILTVDKKAKVWKPSFLPSENLDADWEGHIKDSLAQGKGRITYFYQRREAAVFEGNIKNGYAHGYGIFVFNDNTRLMGNFEFGKLNGYGKITYPDSNRLIEGNFKDGNFLNLDTHYLMSLKRIEIAKADTTYLYVGNHENKNLYYEALVPSKPKAVLVLLPGTWESTEMVLSSNKQLVEAAYEKNIAIIVPSINQRVSLNQDVKDFLNTVFRDAIKRFALPANKFALGGLSSGGLFSLRYAEMAIATPSEMVVQPYAVFSVDGPVDLENLYYGIQRKAQLSPDDAEVSYAKQEFDNHFNGSPDNNSLYLKYSAFSAAATDGGNAKHLLKLPVRIYCDVDVQWWIENRNADIYDMNALDQSAMINYLRKNGNLQATFINAYQKGYLIDGSRHPHSWSLIDAPELLQWLINPMPTAP